MNPGETSTPSPLRKRVRRLARALFRCFRTTLAGLLLIAGVLGLFLNKVGLPGYVKRRVIEEARARGLDVEFSRLRLRWYRGIVAENLHIQSTNHTRGPQLFVEDAECPLNPGALRNFGFKMNSLRLRGGRLIWPLSVTNEPKRAFVLNQLNGRLLFDEDGVWDLQSLSGEFHGMRLELRGSLANAAMLRQWKIAQGPKKPPGAADAVLHQIETWASQFKTSGESHLKLAFRGDAKDPSSIAAKSTLSIPLLESTWGRGENVTATSELIPLSGTNTTPSVRVKGTVEGVLTRWGKTDAAEFDFETQGALPNWHAARLSADLYSLNTPWTRARRLSLLFVPTPSSTNASIISTELTAQGELLSGAWGQALSGKLRASGLHSGGNWMPGATSAELDLARIQTGRGDVQAAGLHASVSLPSTNWFRLFETNLGWAERFLTFPIDAKASVSDIHSPKINLEQISFNLASGSEQLKLTGSTKAGDGKFALQTVLDPVTRELSFSINSRMHPERIATLLFANLQRLFADFTFEAAPKLQAEGRLLLPPWTNQAPDWVHEIMPSMIVTGSFETGPGAFRTATFTSAQSPFSFSNLLLRVPSFKLISPQGVIEAEYSSHPLTGDFHSMVHSQIDPQAAKPLLQINTEQHPLDFFKFSTPPEIHAEISGSWGDLEQISAKAELSATNFTFRGEEVKSFKTHLQYTNAHFAFLDTQLQRENGEQGLAAGIGLDLRGLMLYFTNGYSTLNPYVVARVINQPAIDAIAPYQFDLPPTVRLDGALDLKRKRYQENLHFQVSGHRFHWQQIQFEQLMGNIDWVGQTLTLTNLAGSLKTGRLAGDAYFDFTARREPDFRFKTTFDKAGLREVATVISGKTNKLEGLLDGVLVITQANSGDFKSWQGYGHLKLQDGLLWDIPVFGIFSPILNGLVPGLGNSRANEANATFLVTNGVFFSKGLEIHASMMRMLFKGAVGLNRRVDARVEAELLRDLPAVGLVVSKIFWPVTKLFEYKVTGTLDDPKAEPLYVLPKIVLVPFHPFKALKGLFFEEPKEPESKKP